MAKFEDNDRRYAGLPEPKVSRQVARRFIRKQAKAAVSAARQEVIRTRRQKAAKP